jgi:two-component system, NarL family, invasion response regulator UvrY
MSVIKVAIADDHALLRKGLVELISDDQISVVVEASNGKELIQKIKSRAPHIVLMDINMPEMDGFEATQWLKKNMPNIRVIALSMFGDDISVIRMIRAGAKGYLLKDTEPKELKRAIHEVAKNGFHYTELVSGKLMSSLGDENNAYENPDDIFTDREIVYMRHACSDLNHKDISLLMEVSARTVDGYRDSLYQKLGVSSRVSLVLYAIKHKIVLIDL